MVRNVIALNVLGVGLNPKLSIESYIRLITPSESCKLGIMSEVFCSFGYPVVVTSSLIISITVPYDICLLGVSLNGINILKDFADGNISHFCHVSGLLL